MNTKAKEESERYSLADFYNFQKTFKECDLGYVKRSLEAIKKLRITTTFYNLESKQGG